MTKAEEIRAYSKSITKFCGMLAEKHPRFQRREGETPSEWRDGCVNAVEFMLEVEEARRTEQ